jgi:hypothetical protein
MTINCSRCGSKIKEINYTKRGILMLLLAIPLFLITFIISKGTIIPFINLAMFITIGVGFLVKKRNSPTGVQNVF